MKRLALLILALFMPAALYAQGGCVLKQSTAGQEISIGRFVDSTDGNTQETGLTIANTDIRLKKGTADWAAKNSGGGTHEEFGNYRITLDATDTATLGILEIAVHVSGALSVEKTCLVVPSGAYDVLVTTGPSTVPTNFSAMSIDASGRLDVIKVAGTTQTAGDIIGDTNDLQLRVPVLPVVFGTSDSGSTTTMVDAARTEADNDWWKGSLIRFTSGTVSGQTRLITGFTASTDTITFTPATTAAVGTQNYEIVPEGRVDVASWAGTAVSTPATAGIPEVNIKNIDNDAASASGTVTFPNATLASTTNITAGTITTSTNVTTVNGLAANTITAAAIAADAAPELGVALATGTAQSGGATSIVLAAAENFGVNNNPVGALVTILSGTGKGQSRVITAYTNTTDTATVDTAWTTNPDNTSVYAVIPFPILQAAPTNFGLLAVDANGRTQVQYGTSTGQISATAGVVDGNVTQFGGTNLTSAAGIPSVNVAQISLDSAAADNLESEYDGTGFGQILQRTTIATLANQADFTLTAGSADNNAYNNALVVIQDSATPAQKAFGTVSDYVGSTKQLTLTANPGIFTMAVGDIVTIIAASSAGMGGGDATLANQTQILTDIAAVDAKVTTIDTVVDSIKVDTGTTLPARIPAALIGGRMDSNVGAMTDGVITAAKLAANSINASKLDTDVATEIQTGLNSLKRATAITLLVKARNAAGAVVTGATPTCQMSRDALGLSGTGITNVAEIGVAGVYAISANAAAMTGDTIYLYCTFAGGFPGSAVYYDQFIYTQK